MFRYSSVGDSWDGGEKGIHTCVGDVVNGGDDRDGSGIIGGTGAVIHDGGDHILRSGAGCHDGENVGEHVGGSYHCWDDDGPGKGTGLHIGRIGSLIWCCAGLHGCYDTGADIYRSNNNLG